MNPAPAFVLDTNVIIHAVRGSLPLRQRLMRHRPTSLVVTTITVAELEYGSLKAPQPDLHRRRWREAIREFAILDFDEPAARAHAAVRLALRRNPIGERDLLIAAIAQAHGLGVVTSNTAEFTRVHGLRVEDWNA